MRIVPKFVIFAAALLSATAANAQRCRRADEMDAIAIRSLHTELMVSALSCIGQTEDSFRNRYGSYVQKFNADLVRNGSLMKSYFGGNSNLDRFMTQLANVIAQSSRSDPNFCIDADNKLNTALSASVTSITQIPPAPDYASRIGVHACAASTPRPAQGTSGKK